MTVWGTSKSGQRFLLGDPQQALFARDSDAPADQFRAVFPADRPWEELKEVTVYWEDAPAFRGVVDEQITALGANGWTVEVICRSREALLLDNEACPGVLSGGDLETLEEHFLLPLGLTLGAGDRSAKAKSLAVSKGESCWAVIESFCRTVLGVAPYVDGDGRLQCGGLSGKTWELGQVLSARWEERPCRRLSEVVLQSARGTYDTVFRGESGALRRRYLSRTAGKDPRALLAQSQRESRRLTVVTPGEYWPGREDKVNVTVPGLGRFENWAVAALRVRRDGSGLRTQWTLEGGDGPCG